MALKLRFPPNVLLKLQLVLVNDLFFEIHNVNLLCNVTIILYLYIKLYNLQVLTYMISSDRQ